jgi:hypothetical protein
VLTKREDEVTFVRMASSYSSCAHGPDMLVDWTRGEGFGGSGVDDALLRTDPGEAASRSISIVVAC